MCAIIGVTTDKPNVCLTIYNALTVLQHRGQDAAGMATFDMTGKLVKKVTPNAVQTIIDGTSLNSGIYLAQISSGNSTSTVKLVKL